MSIFDRVPDWFNGISDEMKQTNNNFVNENLEVNKTDNETSELTNSDNGNSSLIESNNGNSVTDLVRRDDDQTKDINFGPYTAICVNNFVEEDIPPRKFLLSPWLPRQGLAMVYAPRGLGKTHFALEVAYTIASGGEFLGWKTTDKGRVLFIDGEMPAPDIQNRLKLLQKSRGVLDQNSLELLTPDKQNRAMPDLTDSRSRDALNLYLDRFDLIIIDNISTLCRSGNENDADSWESTQAWALRQRSSGRSVLFVHHAGKGGQQRGTSKREDVMDTVIALKRPQDYQSRQGARFEVHFEKARGFSGNDANPLEVSLSITDETGYSWKYNCLEDSLANKIIELSNDGLSQTEIADELNINKSTVSRKLKAIKDNI